ncbi:hypothetical protein KIN20_024587 [Parelaphostrongylus tenuis]|uniref:Uncharacterized protein n=1 Tax=Parelaphostrongylus tenuis TaxID=148309 RepID=A0AAD5QTR4_PARTN|nr:hypothetical protein KIN20_024587 [Parelaphostrongylus tenuis]
MPGDMIVRQHRLLRCDLSNAIIQLALLIRFVDIYSPPDNTLASAIGLAMHYDSPA